LSTARIGSPEWIKGLRSAYGLTQSELASRLGVTLVTISRWENGQARPNKIALKALTALAITNQSESPEHPSIAEPRAPYSAATIPSLVDFRADPDMVRLFIEGERLQFGHLFSPSFGTETALIDALPHQLIAVYNHMLTQPRLRFLLADDAGAGKTIMTGLYIREMLNRKLIRRVLIVPPAGLVGNWKREMRTLFSLYLREVTGADCRDENPFAGTGSDLAIVSLDTISSGRAFERLADEATEPYELVVFDEAHKLAASRNADLTYETTDRYKLAELLAGAEPLQETRPPRKLRWHAHHLLLLTATPHMGKDFPYYALWRLLEPGLLRTVEAFNDFPREARSQHFIRRTKEEMVRFDHSRIYPTRISDTASYDLTTPEWDLYEATTSYVRVHYNKARILNRSAARLAMSILQRRAASSTWALLRSLERRRDRLEQFIAALLVHELTEQELKYRQERLAIADTEETKTSDEETTVDGREEREASEDEAMGGTTATTLAELQAEKLQVEELLAQAQEVYGLGLEAKFERLNEVVQDPQFKDEKFLIFTEHRDTMDYLVQRLEGMGYTGQVARIHGGMPYPDREKQMDDFQHLCRFMVATDAAGEGINLQFCWIMVNYDIPWNPARIEQRFGRIHRYKQEHDPVILVNLVANRTREGKVLRTLLDKLESIRKELHSDKVFDVIGRQFQGLSLSELIMRAVMEDSDEEAKNLDGMLTKEQVKAIEETEAKLLGTGGDVASLLPALLAQREHDQLRYLLPGYVRNFVEKTAPQLGIHINGDLNGRFRLHGLPITLAISLEEVTGGNPLSMTINRPKPDEDALFLRPGEHFFDCYRAYFCDRIASQALRGAAFVDPYTSEPYLYHLALVTAVRKADSDFSENIEEEQVVDLQLVALAQPLNGEPRQCPVELLMLLRPLPSVPPSALPPDYQVTQAIARVQNYLREAVLKPMVAERRQQLENSLTTREEFVKKGFDYQEAELLQSRVKLSEQARQGDRAAVRRLEEIKRQQHELKAREDRLLSTIRREPQLIDFGEVMLLSHVLVLPSRDPEDKLRHDQEVERIAMQVARAFEESFGARVEDVSTPQLAIQAGLSQSPGFDLLSHRPSKERRSIEVKGRRSVGDIELTENEWARAANLRQDYWLYVVYDCATGQPRLLRVQDPFQKLIVKAKGGVIIDEASVFEVAEEEKALS